MCFLFHEFPFQRSFGDAFFLLCGRGHIEPDSRLFVLIHASFICVCIRGSKGRLLRKRSNHRESPVGLRASRGESTYFFFVKVLGHIQSIKKVVCNRTHESRQTYSLSGLIFGKYIVVMYFFPFVVIAS